MLDCPECLFQAAAMDLTKSADVSFVVRGMRARWALALPFRRDSTRRDRLEMERSAVPEQCCTVCDAVPALDTSCTPTGRERVQCDISRELHYRRQGEHRATSKTGKGSSSELEVIATGGRCPWGGGGGRGRSRQAVSEQYCTSRARIWSS